MVKLVTKIPRRVAGRDLQPGDEFDVDEKTAHVLTQSGHAEASVEKPKAAEQAKVEIPAKVAEAPKAPDAPKPATPAKASTEVKPMTLADQNPPQGEYATRDLKAKG